MSLKKYFDRISEVSNVANSIKSACVNSQLNDGVLISNQSEWANSIADAAQEQPLFEALGSKAASTYVATAWGSAISDYCDRNGEMPRDEILASCGETLASMVGLGHDDGVNRMMMESLGGKASLETSEGVEIRAKTGALILPVALAAATNDAATFCAGGRDEVEVFEISRIAGTSFGDVVKGEVLDDFFDKQFTGLKQVYALPTQADGTKTKFVVYIYNESAPAADADALISVIANNNPKGIGYRQRSLRVYLDGKQVGSDLDNGNLYGRFTLKGVDYSLIPANGDATKGIIAFQVTPALPADAGKLVIQYDVSIEGNAAVLPEIQHKMSSFKLNAHESVIAAQHTIMAYWSMSREFGIDLTSLQTGTQRNVLAYERDRRNLRDMLLAASANPTLTVDLTVPAGSYFREKYEELHQYLLELSQQMLVETKTTGLVGLYAGSKASCLIKALGAPFFIPAPNYRQVPRVHFVGTLFGQFKVFEVPVEVEFAGLKLSANDMIGYGRGSDYSQAGLIVGEAIAPTLYRHGVSSQLFNRDTLWEKSFGDISPRAGYQYFRKITITK